jgi:hypothetical protein
MEVEQTASAPADLAAAYRTSASAACSHRRGAFIPLVHHDFNGLCSHANSADLSPDHVAQNPRIGDSGEVESGQGRR